MKQLAGYLLKEKFKLMLLVVFSIVVVVLSLWNTSYIALVTNKTYEVLAGEITDEVYFDALKSASISMIIIMVLMAASNIASGYFAGKVAIHVVEDIRNIYDNYGFQTQILAASIRTVKQVEEVAKIGSDVATMPFKIIKQLFKHPLTDNGLAAFVNDVKKIS